MMLLEKSTRLRADAAGRGEMTVCAAELVTQIALALLSPGACPFWLAT
jgi:hypothetical protein